MVDVKFMELERIAQRTPGYDCEVRPCGKNGCGKDRGSSHGRHGEEWIYVLKGRELGLFAARLHEHLAGLLA